MGDAEEVNEMKQKSQAFVDRFKSKLNDEKNSGVISTKIQNMVAIAEKINEFLKNNEDDNDADIIAGFDNLVEVEFNENWKNITFDEEEVTMVTIIEYLNQVNASSGQKKTEHDWLSISTETQLLFQDKMTEKCTKEEFVKNFLAFQAYVDELEDKDKVDMSLLSDMFKKGLKRQVVKRQVVKVPVQGWGAE